MRLQGPDADRLLIFMDSGVPEIHMRYRQKTHRSEKAADIALMVAMLSETPEPDLFLVALADALDHIKHDSLYNAMMYSKPHNRDNTTDKLNAD